MIRQFINTHPTRVIFTNVVEKTRLAGRPGWRLPVHTAIVALFIFTPLAFLHPDTFLFVTVFVVAPALFAITIVAIVWLIYDAVCYGQRQLQPILGALAILWAIPISLFFYNRAYPFELRESARWFSSSQKFKNEVLAQPTPADRDLKHIEWDASGWAGIAYNTVYLVFDPADTLSRAAKSRQPGKFDGIPCEVRLIRRLDSHWYAVLFYTDELWDQGKCK